MKAGEGTTAPRAEILYYLRFLFADPDAVEIDSVEAVLNGVVIGSALYREMWMGPQDCPGAGHQHRAAAGLGQRRLGQNQQTVHHRF